MVYAGAGFSWARSLLEHRILQMTARSGGRRMLRAGGLLLGSALVLLSAGLMPKPPSMQAWEDGSFLCQGSGQGETQVTDLPSSRVNWRS